jgi:hypothetical protein
MLRLLLVVGLLAVASCGGPAATGSDSAVGADSAVEADSAAGTDSAVADAVVDAAAADAGLVDDGGADGDMAGGDGCGATCQWEPQPTCTACREARRHAGTPLTGGCNALMGCENLTDTADSADRQLCEALLACMYAHPPCWATTPADPTVCYCGTAKGLACASSPNGACVAEVVAATKATPSDYSTALKRFYNTFFPSGHATQQIACDTKCVAAGNTCP